MESVIDTISGIVSSILLPIISVFLFYDSRKRKEEAQARKEELEAKKTETDNITSYAAEWKKCYEEERAVEMELNAKIDKLYKEKNEDRQQIRQLYEKNTKLEIEIIRLDYQKCLRDDCGKRLPPRKNAIQLTEKDDKQ